MLEQGDLIRSVRVTSGIPSEENSPPILLSNVVVLSHGCDIDKPNAGSVLVARAMRLSALQPGGLAGEIRRNRVRNTLYLPAEDPLSDEAYIDWRTVQPVAKEGLLAARASGRYICTITNDLLDALADGLWRFFFRDNER